MDKELPSYYSIIPATVRYDHNLKANEKRQKEEEGYKI